MEQKIELGPADLGIYTEGELIQEVNAHLKKELREYKKYLKSPEGRRRMSEGSENFPKLHITISRNGEDQ